MSENSSAFTSNIGCNQKEYKILRYNRILEGINRIFSNVVNAETEEELGNTCLSVALDVTGSLIGFVGEVGADGLLHDTAISEMGWNQCLMYDKTGHRHPPRDFVLHGLYGSVIHSGKSFFTNNPQSHPDSIGLPQGHPPLTSFLGVPLALNGKKMGLLAVANREGGYSFEQQEDLEAIAPAVAQALQRKKEEEQRKKAEEALHESEERLRLAQQVARIGAFEWNIQTGVNIWTPELETMYGLRPGAFGKTEEAWEQLVHPEDRQNAIHAADQAILTGEPIECEWRVIWPDGSVHWLMGRFLAFRDIEGQPQRLIGMNIDITKQKEAEEGLAKIEIARKKEIHHRIKNNLQVISSLLDLQAEQFKDGKCINDANIGCTRNSEVMEAFRESQNRVISMALIHEELHKGGEFDTLNFSQYIKDLVDSLFLNYRLGNEGICLDMDVEDDIYFDIDVAVPLGIIINELVSNSLKYAFLGRDKGEIQIKLHREGRKSTSYVLSISDNGIGIPEDLEIENLDGLGLQLVTTLVEQLDGELELKREKGTEFIITFTVTEKDNRASVKSLSQLVDND